MKKILSIILLLFLLAGCASTFERAGYVKKNKVEMQIESIKIENQLKLDKKIEEISLAKKVYIDSILDNFQYTSDWLYGARLGVELIPNKDRLWTIIDKRLQTSASYAPAPSKKALEDMNKSLREELDTVKITNEELDKKYKLESQKSEAAVKEQLAKELIIKQKEEEVVKIKLESQKKIDDKQTELNTINNSIIEKEKKNSEDKIYIEKNKRLIMSVCGILALASLAGAIWSPVSKKEFAIFGAVMGGVTIIIPFVQPFHIAIFVGAVLCVVVFIIVKKYGVAQKSSENLVNFIQTVKDNKPEIYTAIKNDLMDANKKYATDEQGKTIKVEDKAVEDHITGVLKDYEKI